MSHETKQRWCDRLELTFAELERLLRLLRADAKTCRLYQQEVAAMLKKERAVRFSQEHFLHARPIQLAALTNLYPSQFTAWFNTPGSRPGRTTRRLLTGALGITEDELVAAIYRRQQKAVEVKRRRALIDRHLSERSW